MITKKSYWRQFQDGLLSEHSVKFLVHHTDVAIDNECSLNESKIYVQLVRLKSTIDKEKFIPGDGYSEEEQRKLKLSSFLDSIPVTLVILFLVFTSCILAFVIDPISKAYKIIEHTVTIIFFAELCARLYCVQNWQAFVIDPYLAIDIVTVSLDVLLLGAGDLLGDFSEYSKSLRTFRFLKLVRILRLARIANRLQKVKIAGKLDFCVAQKINVMFLYLKGMYNPIFLVIFSDKRAHVIVGQK